MDEISYSQFNTLSKLINDIKPVLNIDKGVKRTELFLSFESVVGKKFSGKVRPVNLTQDGVLLVACKNAMVTNELFMFKDDILKKLESYSKKLNVEVNDIVFSHKYWSDDVNDNDYLEPLPPYKPSDEELNDVYIDDSVIEGVKRALLNNKIIPESQKEVMLNAIVNNLKEQELKRLKEN